MRGSLRRNGQSRTTQKRELRGCLRRNGPDHQYFETKSRCTGPRPEQASITTAPRSASCLGNNKRELLAGRGDWSPEFRGCLRRNGPDHLARGSWEPRVSRMSQAKRPIPDNSETRVARTSQAKRPGPPPKRPETLLDLPSAGTSFYHNNTPFSKLFGDKSDK